MSTVLPPQKLYHPVLLCRCNSKLLFCQCRTCAEGNKFEGECSHFGEEERALTVTWVLHEVCLAVSKGYSVLEVNEVYRYDVTQYDPKSGAGGLFVQYINTFLKLKAEASGYPDWVQNTADEERYVRDFRESEGIVLEKDAICPNAARPGFAKFCLNSMWEKLTDK